MSTLFDIIRELGAEAALADIVVLGAGAAIFAIWAAKIILGRNPLADSRPRRNNLHFFSPLIPFAILLIVAPAAVPTGIDDWQTAAIGNTVLCAGGLLAIVASLVLAHRHFARRLKGWGLDFKSVFRDAGAAFVNLLAVSPVFLTAVVLTLFCARLFVSPDFELPHHEGLDLITEYSQLPVRISMIILAVVIAPVSEEMLFRGFIQTMFLSHLRRPWVSVAITSGLFAAVHPDVAHWPALFVLSMCMGYAYEKSGSLLRPIFIHAMFNGTSVLAALYAQ